MTFDSKSCTINFKVVGALFIEYSLSREAGTRRNKMYIIIDCDDMLDLKIVKEDILTGDSENTIFFDSVLDANDYAARHCGECQIVEVIE